ncbi:MAG: endonuclease [Paludibacteraceae bacterium]|nr:endonuclease [Paludibacteraceae bacterium]
MKKITLLAAFFACLVAFAEKMPDGYYQSADGKQDEELKTALYNIIKVGSRQGYGSGSWTVFYYSDRREDGSVWDMYSDTVRYFTNPGTAVSGMNIEHSFAKSWWGGTKNDAYKDCYHLNPSESTANSARSNYPLGVVTNVTKTAGSLKIGTNPEYKTLYPRKNGNDFMIWEPKDEYKGDFARAYFYMATCYQDLTWRIDNDDVGSKFAMQNDNYLEFQEWEQQVLLDWHRMDPVSQKEITRMDAVSDYQHNRNPFIDYPCLVEYIWGNKQGQKVDFKKLKNTADSDWLTSLDMSGCTCSSVDTKDNPAEAQIKINVEGKNIFIYGINEDTEIKIYDATGRLIIDATATQSPIRIVNSGFYLLQLPNKTHKILIP